MTSNLSDFNYPYHRVSSATATFQKGIYHLFFLVSQDSQEWYAKILRTYQCLFQLCITQLLLDFDFKLSAKDIQPRLRKLCKNPDWPLRSEIDPAALVTHSVFENRKWKGLQKAHPLHLSSIMALDLYQKTVDARHHMIYRPFMLDNYWEDCTLINLLGSVPTGQEVEVAYKSFLKGMLEWVGVEQDESSTRIAAIAKALRGELYDEIRPVYAGEFLLDLFKPYCDRANIRPTESLLLTYARMLNPTNEALLRSIMLYRNQLIDSISLAERVQLQSNWQTDEFNLQQ